MKTVTGIFHNKETKHTHRYWLTNDGIEQETLSKASEKSLIEDHTNPIWILRHSLGTDQGPEDYSSIDFEKYLSQDRKHLLERFVTKSGIKDLVYRGINVPVPNSFYSHAVGPIHAGVIEPGHFRFIVKGEEIQNLDIRLGFQKRGLTELMKGLDKDSIAPYGEAISGDSTIAYGIAFSKAFEGAHAISVPQEIDFARAVLLEIERIAIHIGDMGAIAGDVGYYPLQGVCSMQRGIPLGVMEALTGNRFGRGALSPGKVRLKKQISAEFLSDLAGRIASVTKDVASHFERSAEKSTNRERLQVCGTVLQKQVKNLGFVGMVEKCTGLSRDLRKHDPSYKMTPEPLHVDIHHSGQMRGDAWSRFYLRYQELKNSGEWLASAIPMLIEFPKAAAAFAKAKASKPKPGVYFGSAEGWRGPVLIAVQLDSAGSVQEAYVRDPSVMNWHALELAVRGENIGDFPLNNKSFNLSYVGVDL
ncbi:metal (Ni/Fe) hydrogenase large subunit [Leptospira fletcheri]|uniref:Metal (Ni/Fe) hydrogenase large subunit n=1 Tax=Leptospira fletcheri TaxID=2484981 RepID=A0A4R9GA99_9LEPT|nr:metal (Ni/Fe) hydrogenase large subunit [Leptospira fletcheri]TGK08648.1 metal (Ni/Fe) hydrogenase large subunit [Leptospira fletcheri]